MKKTTFFMLFCSFLFAISAKGQGGFIQLGTIQVEDQGHRMIATSDGGYITAGSAGPKAVLYKTDCLGQLVAKIEKTYLPGPAAFWDLTELSDGSIVAVGGAGIATPTDTGGNLILLKTTPMLVETASSNFKILNKEAQGKSITKTPMGHLLIWGEVTGFSIDFTDAFFQRVSPVTLQPTAAPVIFNNGVDLASRILPTSDGNYLLSGSSFAGNIFNPDAPIDNNLRAFKVDENGTLIWQTKVQQTFLAKYGVARCCGAAQSSQSGNFVLGGHMFGGTDALHQDVIYALINPTGSVLDTAYSSALLGQRAHVIGENAGNPGIFTILGDSEGSPFGAPSLMFSQAIEVGDQILTAPAFLDPSNPVSLRDFAEIDPGRFAYMATLPDNPVLLGATDIIIVTPEATVEVVYQNCALAATFSNPGVAFQWVYEGQAIPNANQGVYFPTQPGLYQVAMIDVKGCYGISDTFRVLGPMADFVAVPNGLSASFTNTSQGANSYAWNFGDGSTSTQISPSHVYAAKGVYSVQLIATNPCGLKDTLVQQIGVTPTEEPSWLSHFSLSPNPTSGAFTVELVCAGQEKLTFSIFNAVGQLIENEMVNSNSGLIQKTFDLGQWPAGVYSLQIRSDKEAKNVRVVKR